MDDAAKLGLVAIAMRELPAVEAWELVDRLTETTSDLRVLTAEVASEAAQAAWGQAAPQS